MAKGKVEIQLGGVTTFRGPPLSTEPGIGALTLGGFLREVTDRHADREAIAFHPDGGRGAGAALELRGPGRRGGAGGEGAARARRGEGRRVSPLLMGNRPEWVAAAYGVALAGAVLVPLNTWYEPPELAYVLRHSDAAAPARAAPAADARLPRAAGARRAARSSRSSGVWSASGTSGTSSSRRATTSPTRGSTPPRRRSRPPTTRSSSTRRAPRPVRRACSTRTARRRCRRGASRGSSASSPTCARGARSRSSGPRASTWSWAPPSPPAAASCCRSTSSRARRCACSSPSG